MPQFQYEAIDADDQPVQGVIEAAGVAAAAAQLEELGLMVRSITQVVDSVPPHQADEPSPAPPELIEAMRRLLDQRETLLEPLAAYAKEAPGRDRRGEIRSVLDTLQRGGLDEAVAAATRNPRVWAPLLAATVQGEESVLPRLAHDPAKATSARRQRWSTIAYPLVVLSLLMLVLWTMASSIVPVFRQIFNGFGLELPAMTEFVLAVSSFLSSGGAIVLIAIAVAVAAAYASWPQWRGVIDNGWLGRLIPRSSIPVGAAAGRLRVAADLLRSGLSAEDSRRITGLASASRPAIEQVTERELSAIEFSAVFEALSVCYSEQSQRWSASLAASLGAVTIVLVGMVLGVVVISLFMPFVNLVENLT